MDADTYYVESEHDFSDDLGSKTRNTFNGVLHIKDVQQEKYAPNSENTDIALENAFSLSGSFQIPPVELTSAMKGSREKAGVAPKKKLTVSWDPEVYDPPPTDLDALLTKSKEQQEVPKEIKVGRKHKTTKDFSQIAAVRGKESSKVEGKDKKKKHQHRGSSKNYNIFDDETVQSSFSGSVEDYDSYKSKEWDYGEKKRQQVVFVRNYDLPPSDSDEEEEDTAAANPGS